MKMPGFTADAALCGTRDRYRQTATTRQADGGIRPAQSFMLCGNKFTGQTSPCPTGESCGPKRSRVCSGWWIFRSCDYIQTVDWFCQ
jgi:hypothetical protein